MQKSFEIEQGVPEICGFKRLEIILRQIRGKNTTVGGSRSGSPVLRRVVSQFGRVTFSYFIDKWLFLGPFSGECIPLHCLLYFSGHAWFECALSCCLGPVKL